MGARLPGLTRALGPRAVVAIAAGGLGAAPFVALGPVVGRAEGLSLWVLLGVGLVMMCAAAAYAEGLAAAPEAGGSASLVRRAFTDQVGFVAGWLVLLDYLVAMALAAVVAPRHLAAAAGWEALEQGPWDVVAGVLIVLAVAGARLVRRTPLYRMGLVLAAVALSLQALLAALGLALLATGAGVGAGVDLGASPGWGSLAFAVPLAALAYLGVETAANLASEARDPGRDLPRGLLAGLALVIAINVALAVAAVSAGLADADADAQAALLVHLAGALDAETAGWIADAARWLVAVSGTLVLVAAVAIVFSGTGRLAYSLGQREMLPHACARLNRRTLISPTTVVAAAAVATVLIVVSGVVGDPARVLVGVYGFGILVVLTLVQAAVLRLRVAEPGLARPFTVPGAVRLRGVRLPVLPLVGGLLTAALWVALLATHRAAVAVGAAWLAAGVVIFVLTRRAERGPLLGRVEAPRADLVPGPETAHRRVLVPLKASTIGDESLASALRLAAEGDSAVRILHVVRVPMDRALETSRPEVDADARATLSEAQELASEHGVVVEGRIVRARAIGEAIVSEAREQGSDLVVMGSSARWRRQARFFSPTVEYVLKKAPCEVMVVAYPPGLVDGREEETLD